MPLHSDSLLDLITRFKELSGLDEFKLWALIERGLHSYWKRGGRHSGLGIDEVIVLKRAAHTEAGWYLDGTFIPMDEWLRRYQAWS